MTIREEITLTAIAVLKNRPAGLKYTELVHEIGQQGKYQRNTIMGTISYSNKKFHKQIYRPGRGLYKHVDYMDKDLPNEQTKSKSIKEENFYQPFTEWLINEVEDVTHAIPLGGNKFGDRWGTPDVIGKKESKVSDIIKGGTEIVSAEIKTDMRQLITAFGQACAYKLFSHKCYLVVPKESSQSDLARLDSLCQLFGIGLVLFDASNTEDPNFEIRARPQKHEPDLYYTNENMGEIVKELWN